MMDIHHIPPTYSNKEYFNTKNSSLFLRSEKIRKISVIIAFAAKKIVKDREDYNNSFFMIKDYWMK